MDFHKFVWNTDDPAASQFTVFTKDSAWHELDMSAKVPEGATHVYLVCWFSDAASTLLVQFRATWQSNSAQVLIGATVANIANSLIGFVELDANRKIDYFIQAGMDSIVVTVLGWLI